MIRKTEDKSMPRISVCKQAVTTVGEKAHLQLMVITHNKRLLVHSQKENTLTAVGNTYMFCCNNHMNAFTMFYSHSLLGLKNQGDMNFHPGNQEHLLY